MFTAFMLLTALPAWLDLPRSERAAVRDRTLGAALGRHPATTMRFYDAEAFTARCSDVAVFTTEDLGDYYLLVEELRDGPMFTVPYFRLEDIVVAIEEGHRAVG